MGKLELNKVSFQVFPEGCDRGTVSGGGVEVNQVGRGLEFCMR